MTDIGPKRTETEKPKFRVKEKKRQAAPSKQPLEAMVTELIPQGL